MSLSNSQMLALKAHILADPALAALTSGPGADYATIAEALNATSNPNFTVWKTSVPVAAYREVLVWTEVDGLSVGKARIWDWVTGGMTLSLEPFKDAVRQGLADCWAVNTATRPALLELAKRIATRAEGVLATGTGSNANPGKLTFEGTIQASDIGAILAAV